MVLILYVEFHLINFVLLQMVHIFASETNHFPPIKALFELVTSVTLTIFQQGRHAGNTQLQRVKEIIWFWCLLTVTISQLFACICFFKPTHTNRVQKWACFCNSSCFMKWCGDFWSSYSVWDFYPMSFTQAPFKSVFTLEFLICIRMHSVLFTPGINRLFVWSYWLTGESVVVVLHCYLGYIGMHCLMWFQLFDHNTIKHLYLSLTTCNWITWDGS